MVNFHVIYAINLNIHIFYVLPFYVILYSYMYKCTLYLIYSGYLDKTRSISYLLTNKFDLSE